MDIKIYTTAASQGFSCWPLTRLETENHSFQKYNIPIINMINLDNIQNYCNFIVSIFEQCNI